MPTRTLSRRLSRDRRQESIRQEQAGTGSVRLRFGGGTVRAVPVFGSCGSSTKRVFEVSVQFNRKGRFRFLKTVTAVPVPLSVSGKTVPTVPVSGPGSVPGPSCRKQ